MNASGRNDPVVAPQGADQNTPLDGHSVASRPPHNRVIQQFPRAMPWTAGDAATAHASQRHSQAPAYDSPAVRNFQKFPAALTEISSRAGWICNSGKWQATY
jgi:hypothetical protein